MAEARADDRRDGPGREYAPFLTRTEDCQGWGVGTRDELHGHDPGPPPPSPHASRSSSSRYPVQAAGAGSAAHRAADCRCSPFGAVSRRYCAADVGTTARHHALLRHALACCRAGYHSAQDPALCCPYANRCSRNAAGGIAGGNADDHILFLFAADCGAERGHSWWRSSRFSACAGFGSVGFQRARRREGAVASHLALAARCRHESTSFVDESVDMANVFGSLDRKMLKT